ncbi:putative Cation channel sperm-associated protein 4 [Hypsibius exemplaris]|uniref:Cation channel sperm-associated protein 4 n=1 Tax=Hypsibius exemplaris TaxID=2072580 RepID=A0A1W0WFP5_HYPEX|nr:putative Cation channel sperm-associated protein 4 [Hypsibius exemplaris]
MALAPAKGANPSSFNPTGDLLVSSKRTSIVSEARKTQAQEKEDAERAKRKRNSVAAFKQNLNAELNPFIVVDDDKTFKRKDGQAEHKPQVVRRRILVEPVFSRQEKTAGAGEEQFRQIIFDRGITDQTLIGEIGRGLSNEYELGMPQPLRNVHDYVDYSSEALVHGYVKEHAVGNVLLSSTFRYMVLAVILLNAVLIGLETDPKLNLKFASWFEAIENIIMAAFILEILIKWYYNFDVFWKGGWNILDFIIVCVLFFGSSLRFLGTSRVLRILRVIRAFRSLRDTPLFSGLSLIFQTVARSLPDMLNILLLMILVILLLGVVGVMLFGDVVVKTFGTFPDAIFTIFICQTQRGWIRIFDDFVEQGGVVVTSLRTEMKLGLEERARKASKKNAASLRAIKPSADEEKEKEEDGEHRNTLEPLVEAARNWKTGDVQRRVLLPMFLNMVTVDDLQQFLFLQVALEDNLQGYQKLRARLKHVLGRVRALNKNYFRDLRQPASQTQTPKRRSKV